AAIGFVLGVAASLRGRRTAGPSPRVLARLEKRIERALSEDTVLCAREIEVGALTDGIVELTGRVRDESESDRAVAVVQGVQGVRGVVNRLDIGIVEDHLAVVRERDERRGPGDRARFWYGNRVGMGRRRQGRETDPDRPDDRVASMTEDLGTDRALEAPSEVLEKVPTAVAGHSVKPAGPTDRATVDESSHRRLGNVPPEPIQDLNPVSRVRENVKKGTELTLEEAGLEADVIERDSKDRS